MRGRSETRRAGSAVRDALSPLGDARSPPRGRGRSRDAIGTAPLTNQVLSSMTPVTLPPSGHAAWDDLATWWLSRYKPSTQRTYATYLPRWTAWCAGRGPIRWPPGAPTSSCGCALSPTPGCPGPRSPRTTTPWPASTAWPTRRSSSPPTPAPVSPGRRSYRELQRREVLTVLEYAAFLTTARHLGPTHHAIAVLGGMMGLRATRDGHSDRRLLGTVRGYATLTFVGKGDKPARVPVPIPALGAVHAAIDGRTSGPLLRTRTGAGMDRRSRAPLRRRAPPGPPGSPGPSARTRCAAPSAPSGSTRASRCATSSACCATPARRPPWPATTSAAKPSSATPPTRSPASSPAGPADRCP